MTPITQREVTYHVRGTQRLPVGVNFGITNCVHTFGGFELWRSRCTSVWDQELRRRVSTPSAFRIVKRQGRVSVTVAGVTCKAEFAVIMRLVVVGLSDWMAIRTALVEQVENLGRMRGKWRTK